MQKKAISHPVRNVNKDQVNVDCTSATGVRPKEERETKNKKWENETRKERTQHLDHFDRQHVYFVEMTLDLGALAPVGNLKEEFSTE